LCPHFRPQAFLMVASNLCMMPAIVVASRQGLRFEAGVSVRAAVPPALR
jgi:hypothetical protein